MKKITFISLFVALLPLLAQAQNNSHNMIIELTNGTKLSIGPNDIRQINLNNGEMVVTGKTLTEWIGQMATKAELNDCFHENMKDINDLDAKANILNHLMYQGVTEGESLLEVQEERLRTMEENAYDASVIEGYCPDNHHPHFIDLNLPGGMKWCCCNMGAALPEAYGGYYGWGELNGKKANYAVSNYEHYKNNEYLDIGDDIQFTEYDAPFSLTYSSMLPKLSDIQDLASNCTKEWTTLNGVNGFKFTGSNGNSIFLPAAGARWDSTYDLYGTYGYYWSSTISTGWSPVGAYAYSMTLDGSSGNVKSSESQHRHFGFSIRSIVPSF